MPTYVYRCEQGHTFELFHSISDESPKKCPECGADSKRVPAGGAGFLFRGSGFYITDYRSKGYQESAKKEGGGEKPAEKPKPPGGDTKAAGSGGGGTGGEAPKAKPAAKKKGRREAGKE